MNLELFPVDIETLARDYYLKHTTKWEALLANHPVLPETVPDEQIQQTHNALEFGTALFTLYFPKMFSSLPNDDAEKALLTKALGYANKMRDFTITKHVYRRDAKHYLESRGLTDDVVDRLDTFILREDLRFKGTLAGKQTYAIARHAKKRDMNRPFLRMLHSGDVDAKIRCHFRGYDLEGVELFSFSKQKTVVCDEFEFHHSTLIEGVSHYVDPKSGLVSKVGEPSDLVNGKSSSDFTLSEVVELMSCIILSPGTHSILHKSETTDSIQNWISRKAAGVCKTLPFAWESEGNYETLRRWLAIQCPKIDTSLLPSYTDFVAPHDISLTRATLPALPQKSSHPAKNHPL